MYKNNQMDISVDRRVGRAKSLHQALLGCRDRRFAVHLYAYPLLGQGSGFRVYGLRLSFAVHLHAYPLLGHGLGFRV